MHSWLLVFQLPKRSPCPPAHSWNSTVIETACEDFQLLNYHFPPHLSWSLGGLPLKHWPSLTILLLIRSDEITSSITDNWTNRVTLCNERTVFPVPTLLETGTISSLALLGSLANLHCKERSSTLLWNLKKNTAHEDTRNHPMPPSDPFRDWQQRKVQVLSKRIPHGLTRRHRAQFNNAQLVIQKTVINNYSAYQRSCCL